MLTNLESAAMHGRANGAEGLLLTSWGDGGNHQPWPTMYPGIAYAAGLAWNQKGAKRMDVARAVNIAFSQKADSGYGEILLELGRVENALKHPKPNRSRHYNLFFATKQELKKELKTLSRREIEAVLRALDKAYRQLVKQGEKYLWEFRSMGELQLGSDMAAWGLRRALLAQAKKNPKMLAGELPELIERFVDLWGNRAREGGLRESALRISEIGREL